MADTRKVTDLFARLPNGFPVDKDAASDAWKTFASFNERFAGIAFDAASKSTDLAANSTQETISQLRDVTQVRDEPQDYVQALTDFAQAQFELSRRTAEAFGNLLQQTQTDTTELVGKTAERVSGDAAETAETAADKTAEKTKRAANKAA